MEHENLNKQEINTCSHDFIIKFGEYECQNNCGISHEDVIKQLHKEQKKQSYQTTVNGSNFIIKVDDKFCEWEYGFTIEKACIYDFIRAIEKRFNTKRDYEKMVRGCD